MARNTNNRSICRSMNNGGERRGGIISVFYVGAILCFINMWYISRKMFTLYASNISKQEEASIFPIIEQILLPSGTTGQQQEQEKTAPKIIDNDNNKNTATAIVTKVLWPKDIQAIKQWVCLINHGYNAKAKHDIIVFTTMPWTDSEIAELQQAALPSNLTVSTEGPSLEEQLADMTDTEVKFLRKRCGIDDDKPNNETLSWFHHCREEGYTSVANLGYSWQAEFRAYHIWTHPALAKYKYMVWIDSDALVGTHWNADPIEYMIEHDLTAMYAQFPYGTTGNDQNVGRKLLDVYNVSMCGVMPYNDSKHIYAKICNSEGATIRQIAGCHHITNLDVYRKPIHQRFLKAFTGDYRFSRRADDQLAVTIVAVMEQYMQNNFSMTEVPRKALTWHERSNGMKFMIAHHGKFDGAERAPRGKGAFFDHVKDNFTGVQERCGAFFGK